MSLSAIIISGFLIMLAVLGHGSWHGSEVTVANWIVGIFTGAHVTG